MPASDHINRKLFHGTSADLNIGDVIEPVSHNYIYNDKVAFATEDPEEAKEYAYSSMLSKKKPVGAVYEVEFVDPNEGPVEPVIPGNPVTKKGFRIVGRTDVTH